MLPRFGQLYTEMIFDVLDAPAGADSATVIRAAAVAAADKVGMCRGGPRSVDWVLVVRVGSGP